MLLQGEETHYVISEADYLCKQAVELRMKIIERIFELERDELRTYRSEKSSSSKGTGRSHTSRVSSSSQISILKMKTMRELGRKEVEMKYARIEAEQKKMEMERKRCEMEENTAIEKLRKRQSRSQCGG